MSFYDSLVGQSFRREGRRYTIVQCEGDTVLAAVDGDGRAEHISLSLGDVIDTLEVIEVTLTELPPERRGSA